MKRILITGATGNIGMEVVRFLYQTEISNQIIAGVRNIENAKLGFKDFPNLEYVNFDFDNPDSFDNSLKNIDIVFLLRPPHISEIEKYFSPLLTKIKEKGHTKVIFLSVQGAEKSSVIPHNKIEKLIKELGIDYIFLRPSYFMQNLTTTLLQDIQTKRKIILPAGKAKFNWVDVENIGEVAASLICNFELFKNQAIELTGNENLNFYQVADLINLVVKDKITFENYNPIRFYLLKNKEGMPLGMILVMIMLHFLPRFQNEPKISGFYEKITGKKPTRCKEFIVRDKNKFNAKFNS